MRKIILLFLLVTNSYNFYAQREAYSLVYGNCDPNFNDCNGTDGTAVIRFNDDSILSVDRLNFHSTFQYISTCISDSNGRLLMASNQQYVYDSSGTVLIDFLATDTLDSLRSYRQSAFFFKLNENNNVYYFLNEKAIRITPPTENLYLNNRTLYFFLSKIQIDELGFQVLSIDTLIRSDTIGGGCMQACRHANGRDWWIFKSTFNQQQFLRGLLTPNGIDFNIYHGPGPDLFRYGGQNQFSSDGTKLFHYISTSFRKMQIYDFDRCTGELSNFREIDFSPFIPYPPYDFNPFVLSPDGSKIYMGRTKIGGGNYQTLQIDVDTQEMNIIADSVFVPLLSPNLKWVMAAYQDTWSTLVDDFTILESPNNNANNVNRRFINNCLEVNGAIQEPIEYANHRLGPIDGGSCDTLGLDQDYTWLPKIPEVSFVIYPNPSSNILNVKTNLKGTLKVSILDITGKLVFCKMESNNSFILDEEIKHLISGLYSVTIQNGFKILSAKWVKEQE